MIFAVLKFALIAYAIFVLIFGGLIFSQYPKKLGASKTLDFSGLMASGTPAEMPAPLSAAGAEGQVGLYLPSSAQDVPLVILVHGSGWNSLQFSSLMQKLQPHADTLAVDLRGHGLAPARRGDVDYIGQLEDDFAALIKAYAKPAQKVVLLGHSSGGGLVVRFAGGAHGALMDRAILLAPFLKYDAPTARSESDWAHVLTRRVIGLSMLNSVGITALNHLKVIQFKMPTAVLNGPLGDRATLAYSYRLNTSYAPRRDYLADIAALPRFSLIAGRADETFRAEKYQETMQAVNDKGSYHLLDDVGHLDVVAAPRTLEILIKALGNE